MIDYVYQILIHIFTRGRYYSLARTDSFAGYRVADSVSDPCPCNSIMGVYRGVGWAPRKLGKQCRLPVVSSVIRTLDVGQTVWACVRGSQ